jgi:hypothetical protein
MIRINQQLWSAGERTGGLGRWLGMLCFAGLFLFVTGCGLLARKSSVPKAEVGSLSQSTNRPIGSVSLIVLQAETKRFADTYVALVAQGADDFADKVGTPQAHLAALRWKLAQATAAFTDASGLHPVLNALDLVVLASVSRMVIEDYGVGEVFGEAALPALERQRRLETNAWSLLNGVVKPEQRKELADMIQKWRQENPHQRYIGGIRFSDLAVAVGKTMQRTGSGPTSVFSLLYLDPFASMDPTAAAIQETRYAVERAIYYGQRMPQLINWQVELLAIQLADQPESKQILSNAQQLASSAQIFAETSKQLPQQLAGAFAAEEKKARALLDETHKTLRAGNEMAGSVNAAIKSLDDFVRFVTPTNTVSVTSGTNSRPFNVLDYGTAATQVASAAKELNTLLTVVNESTPQLAKLGQETTERADRVVDRAFRMGLVLIVVFLAGLVLAGVIYHALVKRLTSNRREL